jgi:hypothetical protein
VPIGISTYPSTQDTLVKIEVEMCVYYSATVANIGELVKLRYIFSYNTVYILYIIEYLIIFYFIYNMLICLYYSELRLKWIRDLIS